MSSRDYDHRRPLFFSEALQVLNRSSRPRIFFNGFFVLKEDLYVFKVAHAKRDLRSWGHHTTGRVIVNLVIPKGSEVYLGITRLPDCGVYYKARASKAVVHSVFDLDHNSKSRAYSLWDSKFIYREGATIRPDGGFSHDENVCRPGIHFFLDIGSALSYYI